jgi:hypothetical protein
MIELVRATLRGIKRQRRRTQMQAKPLLRDDLLLVLDAMGNGLKDLRDRALSNGCITVDPVENNKLVTQLQGGALIYVTVGDDPIEQYL